VEQLRLLQLIVLYNKEWREGAFTPKVKYPIGGNLSPVLRSGSQHCPLCPRLQQVTSILCLSGQETNCRISSNPSNTSASVNDTAFISPGVKSATFFVSFGFQLYLFI